MRVLNSRNMWSGKSSTFRLKDLGWWWLYLFETSAYSATNTDFVYVLSEKNTQHSFQEHYIFHDGTWQKYLQGKRIFWKPKWGFPFHSSIEM